ncbi:MAG: hypothetical protein GY778_05750 [bacterium]|nr:hypothetical protein [bacterium]
MKTRISLGSVSGALHRIQAGDNLVVFSTADNIRFIVPTESDATTDTATDVPGGDSLYGSRDWIVAGTKVALVRSNNTVDVYETTNPGADAVGIDAGMLTLHALPTEPYAPGHMTADWPYVAALNDMAEVDDANAVKVIDIGGDAPVVTSFPNPVDFGFPDQVAVDAGTNRVAAYWNNSIYVFDITDAEADPMEFEFNLGSELGDFAEVVQMRFDGDYILYRASNFDGITAILNVADGTVTNLAAVGDFSGVAPLALNGGSFGYLPAAEDVDQIFSGANVIRSAIGTVADPGTLTLADQLGTITPAEADCLPNMGKFGYGSKWAITEDGGRWFLSGEGGVDRDIEYLQMSTGGDFEPFEDPDGDTQTGFVMASDVSASDDTLAFWTLRQAPDEGCLTDDDWVVGFIVLDRLP